MIIIIFILIINVSSVISIHMKIAWLGHSNGRHINTGCSAGCVHPVTYIFAQYSLKRFLAIPLLGGSLLSPLALSRKASGGFELPRQLKQLSLAF